MERRIWSRQSIDLPAVYQAPTLPRQPCRIRDYCPGGLLIACESEVAELLLPGETISITYCPSTPVGNSVFELDVQVKWVTESRFGVQFSSPYPVGLYQTLERESAVGEEFNVRAAPKSVTDVERAAIISTVVDALGKWSKTVFDQLLKEVDSALLQAASEAKSNREQNAFFDAMSIFKKSGATFKAKMSETLCRNAREPEAQGSVERSTSEENLALVDEHEFEDWLLVSGTASRLEERFSEALSLIGEGLPMVYGMPLDRDNNPVSPGLLAKVFEDISRDAYTSEAVQTVVFNSFEKFAAGSLNQLLTPICRKLDESGVTGLVRERVKTRQKKLLKNNRPDKVAKPPVVDGDQHDVINQAAPGNASLASDAVGVAPSSELNHLAALYNLFHIRPGSQGGVEGAVPVSLDELLTQLDVPPVDAEAAAGGLSMGDQLLQQLQAGSKLPRYLQPEHRLPVDLTESILGDIASRHCVASDPQPWLEKLRVPLTKTLLRDPSFMEDRTHPARQALNQLVKLSAIGGPGGKGLQKTLEQYAERILAEYDENPEVFRQILEPLNQLVERQNNAFQRNFHRVWLERQGQERLHLARLEVGREILLHTGSRPVPRIFRQLIEHGWRDILVLALLREGSDSEHWREYTVVMDQLLEQLIPSESQPVEAATGQRNIAEMIDGLYKGFAEAGIDSPTSERLFAVVRCLLFNGVSDENDKWLRLERLDAKLLKPLPPWEEEEGFIAATGEKQSASWLRKVSCLEPKDSVRFVSGADDKQRLVLAWRTGDASHLVFVNEQGREAKKYTLNGLAAELSANRVVVLSDNDVPAVDQGIFAMIQQVYEELAHKASHDEVTSLYNRREFERLLEKAILSVKHATDYGDSACQGTDGHVLCYFDLDQFKVINSNLGPKVGDRLLREIGGLLRDSLPDDTVLARLGGDEFGVLFHGRSMADAKREAENLREAIASYPFRWGGEQHKLTVSGGLVEITSVSEDINGLLKAADHTCYAAKDAGRNRLHVYTESDHAISHKKSIMEWISRIGQALEKDEFRLRAQKIAPLDSQNNHQHSEVLLSVVHDGRTSPVPEELIHAAEAYGHMQVVDRWVVANVLQWMAQNPGKIEQMGGMAINLSGKSLNDTAFLDFVIHEITESGVPPSQICFEVTESAAIANLKGAAAFIEEVKRIGCSFALDDFGVGMSSYAYLKNLPVDYLKIDGSFVRDIAHSPDDLAMVKSINEIGHYLGKKTVAEFAENEEIIKILRDIGVDYAQGYGVEKPYYLDELKSEWADKVAGNTEPAKAKPMEQP